MSALVAVVLLAVLQMVAGHSYHYGRCKHVSPMPDFDMGRFMGRWYVLQKTSTSVRCLINEYSPGHLLQTMILGIPAVNHVIRYHGELSVPNLAEPAQMEVKFPLSIAGRSSYIVFDTDYETYAGVYSCQKLTLWHRHSASILSRTRTLDPSIISRLQRRLDEFGVSSRGLDKIQQTCSSFPDEGIEVNIKRNVVKPTNITEVLGTARDIVNEVSDVAKDVYNVYSSVHNSVTDKRRRRDVQDQGEQGDEDDDDIEEEIQVLRDWLP